MKAKPQGNNGSNPVEAAQSALAEVQAKLRQHDERRQEVDQEKARLVESLDAATLAGNGDEAFRLSQRLAQVHELIGSLVRVRTPLVACVEGAETRVQEAERQAAQEQINRLSKEKVELLTAIVQKIEETCTLLAEARTLQAVMDDLAHQHNLPTPSRQRLMLPRDMIRSPSGEELAAALSPERSFGMAPQPAP